MSDPTRNFEADDVELDALVDRALLGQGTDADRSALASNPGLAERVREEQAVFASLRSSFAPPTGFAVPQASPLTPAAPGAGLGASWVLVARLLAGLIGVLIVGLIVWQVVGSDGGRSDLDRLLFDHQRRRVEPAVIETNPAELRDLVGGKLGVDVSVDWPADVQLQGYSAAPIRGQQGLVIFARQGESSWLLLVVRGSAPAIDADLATHVREAGELTLIEVTQGSPRLLQSIRVRR